MPLDTRKANHIKGKLAKIAMGRTQPITMVLKTVNGTSTITVNAIWREAQDADPLMDPPSQGVPGGPHTGGTEDIVAMFLQSDITLAQLRTCLYAYPSTLLSSEPANRYVITSVTPKGILPGGDRYIVTLTRQR